jgi:hypothetical protein
MPICTCGCLVDVTYATKLNHLKAKGKATLRNRVAAENDWLTQSTSLHQPSKKRSHSTADQNIIRRRRKAAHVVEVEGEPGVFLVDADPMEVLSEPVARQIPQFYPAADPLPEPVADQVPPTLYPDADPIEFPPEPAFGQMHADANLGDPLPEPGVNLAVPQERLRGIMEERWGNGVLREGSNDEDLLPVPGSESDDDEGENEDDGDEGEDEDEDDDDDDEAEMKMKMMMMKLRTSAIAPHLLSLEWLGFLRWICLEKDSNVKLHLSVCFAFLTILSQVLTMF